MKHYFETGRRIGKAEREELRKRGLFVYYRRYNGKDETIEPSVAVDFIGSMVTDFKIKFKVAGPAAFVIFNGNEYLKEIGAIEVYSLDELKGERHVTAH